MKKVSKARLVELSTAADSSVDKALLRTAASPVTWIIIAATHLGAFLLGLWVG